MAEFRGVLSANVVPFKGNEEIDEEKLRSLIDYQLEQGVHGIIPAGSAGEFASLLPEEHKHVIEVTIDQVNGRVPVVAGTSAPSTREAIMYSKFAQDAGANGVMVVGPYYGAPKEEEIYEHYKAIAEAIDIPIMIYNNPGASGVDILPGLAAKLAEIHNISCIKESSGDVKRVNHLTRLCGNKLKIICAWDSGCLEMLFMGAIGWVTGASNVIPGECVQLFELTENGDFKAAKSIYFKILPLLEVFEREGYVQNIKACLKLPGRSVGSPRRPFMLPSDVQKEKLRGILQSLAVNNLNL